MVDKRLAGNRAEVAVAEASVSLADVGEGRRAEALVRYEAIRPFLEEGVPLTRLAGERGRSVRTLRHWVADFRAGGLPSLARQLRSDRGVHRFSEELQILVEALALQKPKRPVAVIHQKVAAEATRRGWKPPSYRQVLAVVRKIDPSLLSLAHGTAKAHKQAHDLLVRFEAASPNERWQVDHKHLDIWVADEKGRLKKPWLTAVEDDHSRAIPGYYLHFDAPSTLHVALAFRQAILRDPDPRWCVCGVPLVFYSDNGAEFKSHHLKQVAAHLGARLDFSIPDQPRGRGKIECFFRTIEQMFLCELPGFGSGGKAPEKTNLLTLSKLDHRFREWLLEVYHLRVHGETGQTPAVRWEAGGFSPRMPEAAEELDLLLLTVATTRKVQRDGIRFSGFRYFDLTLGAYIGESVMIRYDPRDLAEVRVHHEGKFLCRAICTELAGGSYSYKETRTTNAENRKRLRAELRDREAAAEKLLSIRRDDLEDPGETSKMEEHAPLRAEHRQKKAEPSAPSAPPVVRLKGYENE